MKKLGGRASWRAVAPGGRGSRRASRGKALPLSAGFFKFFSHLRGVPGRVVPKRKDSARRLRLRSSRLRYVRPKPIVHVVHRSGSEHEGKHEAEGGNGD